MLEITVPENELFDEESNSFVSLPACTLKLEHSLLSISKWESKWHKPFLSRTDDEPRSIEENLDYIKCMTLTRGVKPETYHFLSSDNIKKINDYIENPMTATTVSDIPGSPMRREIITSELIYYWMVTFGIPFECEKWHINRLVMLIKVCSAKNNPKKMSNRAIMTQNRQLNEARKKALRTRG